MVAEVETSDEGARTRDDPSSSEPTEESDAEILAAQRFYVQMDDDAIALDDAITAAQAGDFDATSGRVEVSDEAIRRLRRLSQRIDSRVTDYLLDEGQESVGGNLLASAAETAPGGAQRGDLADLARARGQVLRSEKYARRGACRLGCAGLGAQGARTG